jgi:hypothetical protein
MSDLGVVGRSSSLVCGLVLRVSGLSLIRHISNIARVGIGNIVVDDLGPAVRKGNAVRTMGGITVPALIRGKVGTAVVVLDSISILVDCGGIILGLLAMVGRGRGMVGGGRGMVSRGMDHWLVCRCGGMVGKDMDGGRCVVSRGMDHRGGVVHGIGGIVSGGMVSGSMDDRGVVGGGGVVCSGMDHRGAVGSRGGVVGSAMDRLVSELGDGSIVALLVLLLIVVLSNLRGLGRRLAVDRSGVGAMGLRDGGGHRWGIALLEGLVVGLVSGGKSQEGEDCDKSLKEESSG